MRGDYREREIEGLTNGRERERSNSRQKTK
jgi:hypothetical protein